MPPDELKKRLHTHREFTRFISVRSMVLLSFAIFFTFAPIGMLLQIGRLNDPGMTNTLMWGLTCGVIAVAWALSFMWTLKLLPVVIGLQIGLPLLLGPVLALMRPPTGEFGAGTIIKSVLCAASIIVGYILFIRFIRGEATDKLRLQTEMSLAKQIHMSLVPQIEQRSAFVEVFGRSEASSEMGGDLIDVATTSEWVDLFLADISGHGVRAGVLMAMVKSSIRTRLLQENSPALSLGAVVGGLNEVVAQVAEPDMFATFACLRVHASRRVEFSLAGHLPILRWVSATGEIEELDNQSLPLGVDALERFPSRSLEAQPGDLFVLLTDGLMEVDDDQGRQLGLSGLKDLIRSGGRAREALPDIYAGILGAVRRHGGQSDDQTLLIARIV